MTIRSMRYPTRKPGGLWNSCLSLEKLKLLAAKPNRWERGSGKAELTWEDVASALSRRDPIHSLYARVCYAGDRSAIRKLEHQLRHILIEHPDLQDSIIEVRAFRKLVWLTLCEAATGQSFPIADRTWPADKIRLLGLKTRGRWYRTYAVIYQITQGIFADMDQRVLRTLKTKLADPVIM